MGTNFNVQREIDFLYCLNTIPIACMGVGQFLKVQRLGCESEYALTLKNFAKVYHVES